MDAVAFFSHYLRMSSSVNIFGIKCTRFHFWTSDITPLPKERFRWRLGRNIFLILRTNWIPANGWASVGMDCWVSLCRNNCGLCFCRTDSWWIFRVCRLLGCRYVCDTKCFRRFWAVENGGRNKVIRNDKGLICQQLNWKVFLLKHTGASKHIIGCSATWHASMVLHRSRFLVFWINFACQLFAEVYENFGH